MRSQALPQLSVIVPTKNRPDEIARMLRSLRAQPTMPLEVIVVDQSTPPYDLEPFPELVHLHEPHLSGLTAARNRGAAAARGDVIFFLDDDVVLENDCVREVALAFGHRPELVGAQCSIRNPWDGAPRSLYDVSARIFEHGFFDQRPRRTANETIPRLIDGLASAYRRDVVQRERFDERLPGYGLGEDWDFTKRAARHGRLTVLPNARVRHEHSPRNRHDATTYARLRKDNVLYLYRKLDAHRDPINRIWKRWWLLGEALRGFRIARRARRLHR